MTDLFLGIAILLFSAKLLGELFERLNLSSLVGEIFAGIIVGPVLGLVMPSEDLRLVTNFGILLLLFLIGLSTKFDEVKSNVYVGSALAIGGCTLAFLGGFLVGYLVFNSVQVGIILGVAVISTSTAITLRSLTDIGAFQSKPYKLALAIDIADEVIAIMALALLTSYFSFGAVEIWKVVTLFLAVLGFFFFILTAGSKILGKFLSLFQTMRDEQIVLSIPLVILFFIAFVSEHVGVAAVTGAFLAGVAINKSPLVEPVIVPKVKAMSYGFFVPMFFAYSAVLLDVKSVITFFPAILALIATVSLGKVLGCGFLAKYFGYNGFDQKLIGIGMIPHGEYSIIIAQLALLGGFIKPELYTIVIAFVIISIVITPLLLKLVNGRNRF
ncbi:MAG: cation:proton antiporter [Candidatus Aenigmarchaeota archaeon]|nr:cation:proton antiporter [Candidatus Aenigmarchaeota archaeon]